MYRLGMLLSHMRIVSTELTTDETLLPRTKTALTIVAVASVSLWLTPKFERVLLMNCRAQMSLLV